MKRSKLLRLKVRNLGCVGDEGIDVALDNIVCLVGKNNSGKSTVLRAYELAHGREDFDRVKDRCNWAPEGSPSEIELDLHIPDGLANIGSEWKEHVGDYRILRSRWQWAPETGFKKVRATWDPQAKDWASDEKAGGADNVFKSRLPRPLRIGSLQDVDKTEAVLLALALDPFLQEIQLRQATPDSDLAQAVASLVKLVSGLSVAHTDRFQTISGNLQAAFTDIFPGLGLRLNISIDPLSIKIPEHLKAGSGIRVVDGEFETLVVQQGTGARRALFWAMLRVHNEIKRSNDRIQEHRKFLEAKLKKKIDKVEKARIEAQLQSIIEGGPVPEGEDDPALPGHLLLIDEPENAMHPMAARAAQRHLYDLAKDPDWQVMMTTHSPYFINPLEDHTTVVRLERTTNTTNTVSTRTYRSETITFTEDEKQQLQAIQNLDVGLAEVFFGSYPVLVEGDTEHAAFIAAITEKGHPLRDKVTVVRARGKAVLVPLIKMLKHFHVDFGILHDLDWPFHSAGKNAMWTINSEIYQAILACRKQNIVVRHRYSTPDFERFLGGAELGKDKPLQAYNRIKNDPLLISRVQNLLVELHSDTYHGPYSVLTDDASAYLDDCFAKLNAWAVENGKANDTRLSAPQSSKTAS
ncbi:ATP-dependent nuclease [Falsiroseomonas sp.]|uniref:ATP-dependent nuclease n=1 Tax=Falsiroseomonas sp. TaxID=2870721 RepID=UPI003F6EF70F